MLDAIESGISWLVDGKGDIDKASKAQIFDPGPVDTAVGPGTLRGAPELRERMAERLRDSEPEPEDELAPMPAPPCEEREMKEDAREDKALNADDSTTADLAEHGEASNGSGATPRYCL